MGIRSKMFRLCALVGVVASLLYLSTSQPTVALPPACADLVITGFTIVPASPVQGQNATINITVLNQGTCPTLSFVVQWKSSQLAPTGPSTYVNGLQPNQSQTVSFTYAFPNAGNFTTVANVDTENTVNETNESNNLAIQDVTVQPYLPDLVVTDFSIVPVDPAPGFPLLPVEDLDAQISITVLNQGNKASGSFVVQWKSAITAPTGPTGHVTNLNPGESTVVTFLYAFPNAGNFTTVATVDSSNTVVESNETNNLAILSTTVQDAVIDLVLKEFKVDPAPGVPASIPPLPVQGRLSRATIVVANEGNFPAGAFVVAWKPTALQPALTTQINSLKYGVSTTLQFDFTYLFAGQFQTTATADSTNRVVETDESNNSITQPVVVEPQRPDLEITSFVIDPAQPVQGTYATAHITIRNRGNTPAGPFNVRWEPAPLAPAQSSQVNALGVGESITVSFDHTYNFAGQFSTTARADSTNRVVELDEDNNISTRQVTVQQATQDLVITDFRIEPDTCSGDAPGVIEPIVVQGDPIKVCITVQNLGNAPVGPFVVQWNPDALGLIVPSVSTLSTQIDSLGAGQAEQVVFDFVYPQAGTFRTLARVDAFNTVPETNEDNNLAILNVIVEPAGPDLLITDMTIRSGNLSCTGGPDIIEPVLTQGVMATVCIDVKNQGNRAAGPFIVEWNPDAFGLITPSPGTLSQQVNSLGVNQSTTVRFNFTYHQHGEFRTVAKADAFNNVAELNEANNLSIVNVVVEPANIDLVITSFTVSPKQGTDIIRGSKAVANITVKNNGTYPTGPFSLQWKITGEDGSGPFARIPGLQPSGQAGDSQSVQLEGVFYIAGPYTSMAVADVFDEVIETNENNNTRTFNVMVHPRQTTVQVSFNSVHVYEAFEDGIGCVIDVDCHGEWKMLFAVADANGTCNIGGQTINGFQCAFDPPGLNLDTHGGVDDGETFGTNTSFTVVLKESTPLILAGAGFELDDFFGVPTDGMSTGFALKLWPTADYMGVGSTTVAGQNGPGDCSNGRCFDVNYTVTVLNAPPPFAGMGEPVEPAPIVTLPAAMADWLSIPPGAPLPPGLQRMVQVYLPLLLTH